MVLYSFTKSDRQPWSSEKTFSFDALRSYIAVYLMALWTIVAFGLSVFTLVASFTPIIGKMELHKRDTIDYHKLHNYGLGGSEGRPMIYWTRISYFNTSSI